MIFELRIKDFILIDEEVIRFDEGLNVITGETGAGKSMILGAIKLILGEQANREHVRIGADKAVIQGSFFTNAQVNDALKKHGIGVDDDIINISREVYAKGKTVARINGEVVTLSIVKSVTEHLLTIHGQHDNQTLLQSAEQLELLDVFASDTTESLKIKVAEAYDQLMSCQAKIQQLLLDNNDKDKQLDFYRFQFSEIETAALKKDEDVLLEKEFEYISNLGKITETFNEAKQLLSGDYGEGFVGELSKLSTAFHKISHYDDKVLQVDERLSNIYYLLEDLAHDIDVYQDDLEFDADDFKRIEDRLDEINHLKSKYGNTLDAIFDYQVQIVNEIEKYENIEVLLQELEAERVTCEKAYDTIAIRLSEERQKAAQHFEVLLQNELSLLNMKHAKIEMRCSRLEHRSRSGMDHVSIYISTNLGQPMNPLKKVVSGGELSRIMLGVQVVLGKKNNVLTLIFDEIDAGISGDTANVVGGKMAELSNDCQLICITHLPQIAVFADHHFKIEKQTDEGLTVTRIQTLSDDARVLEISRLVGGAEKTEATLIHAKEMIESAHRQK